MKLLPGVLIVAALCTAAHAGDFIRTYDVNGDGVITLNEYPGTAESFRKLDVNRDGRISPWEVPSYLVAPNAGTVVVSPTVVRPHYPHPVYGAHGYAHHHGAHYYGRHDHHPASYYHGRHDHHAAGPYHGPYRHPDAHKKGVHVDGRGHPDRDHHHGR